MAHLTNDLRSKYGFEATCDTIRGDGELDTMIVDGIIKSNKVIVIITPDYTYRADNRIGGVGKETKLLYSRFFKDDKSIIPILKEKTKTSAYLESVPYIDFTVGNYSDNLNELAKRLNDKTVYEAANVSDNPMSADDFDLIPDLRINDPNAEEKFLNDEFEETDQRVLSLLNLTQKQYPAFQYKREIKTVIITFVDITFNVFFAELSLLFGTDTFKQSRRGFVVTVLRNELALNGVLQNRFFKFIVNFTIKFCRLLFEFIVFGNQRLKLFNFGYNSFLFRKRRHGK